MGQTRIRVIASSGAEFSTSVETAIAMIITGQYVQHDERSIRFVAHVSAIDIESAAPERQGRPRRVKRPRALDPIRTIAARDFDYGDRIVDVLPSISQMGYHPGTRGVEVSQLAA